MIIKQSPLLYNKIMNYTQNPLGCGSTSNMGANMLEIVKRKVTVPSVRASKYLLTYSICNCKLMPPLHLSSRKGHAMFDIKYILYSLLCQRPKLFFRQKIKLFTCLWYRLNEEMNRHFWFCKGEETNKLWVSFIILKQAGVHPLSQV